MAGRRLPRNSTHVVRLRTPWTERKLSLPDARILATALVCLGSEAGLGLGGRIRYVARSKATTEIEVTDPEYGALLLALGAVEWDGYMNAHLRGLRDSLLAVN